MVASTISIFNFALQLTESTKGNSVNRPAHTRQQLPDPTIKLSNGWHCLHLYYQIDQNALNQIHEHQRVEGRAELAEILNPEREGAPVRLQSSIVSGGRADLGLMIMDTDPLVIDRVQQDIRSSRLGPALKPTYSFVSITEISEYVPTLEQYTERLKRDGSDPNDDAFKAKVGAYEQRLPMMNQQRLFPDFPPFPVTCFYPMNKIRVPGANWYSEASTKRSALMAEHATSGIKFAGRVSQLITASTGFDDWEWGVTLWGRAPEHIKDIVYTMRFDEASAKYAEFGPFYISYISSPEDAISHLKL
jgi:hydrogen peroxide-dependent heme synthase